MSRLPAVDRRRSAVTLVELLAVIAIMGMLFALTLPALVSAIARGRQTQCTHNQHQIAFALLRYDEQNGSIPGWLNPSPNSLGTACSWTVSILPFLGRGDVYDMWPQLPNNPAIDTFVCPSNRPGRGVAYPAAHYAGNAGAGVLADVTATGTDYGDGVFKNLFTGSNSILSIDMIAEADGASTTLAFAEKSALGFQPHAWNYKVTAAPVGSPFGSGAGAPPIFGAATPPGPVSSVINTGNTWSFAPASAHGGGVVVAFCDGHTAFLRDTIKPYEYGQMLTRRSRWKGGVNQTNTAGMQPWLLRSGTAYLLDETILRQ